MACVQFPVCEITWGMLLALLLGVGLCGMLVSCHTVRARLWDSLVMWVNVAARRVDAQYVVCGYW